MKASLSQLTLAIAVSAALTGCSGSGSGSSAEAMAPAAVIPSVSESDTADKAIQLVAPDYQLIDDANLRTCVETTGISAVTQLQILECPHSQITSLAGLEQFTSLRVLNVRNNVIQSIEELRSLTALNWLDVSYNRIQDARDRKSTRLNSSHVKISYAVFCLKKKKQ